MSVFSDFQRLWQQKFPDSDLSSAWIEDVKLSLTRHKEKIAELTKELEQEQLYVEYLERLLNEVEKYRESGSDPAQLFDAATPTTSPNRLSVNEKNGVLTVDNKDTEISTTAAAKDEQSLVEVCRSVRYFFCYVMKMQII